MKKTYVFILLVAAYATTSAQNNTQQTNFQLANQKYTNNQYQQAITIYKKILQNKQQSPELYYNLANAYFKNKQTTKAIINYEKALKLAPNNEDIKYNLKYANLYIKDNFDTVPEFIFDKIYFKIIHLFSSNTWVIISIITFYLTLSLILLFLFSKHTIRRKLSFIGAIILLIISSTTIYCSVEMKNYFTKPKTAIITNISTIKSSPKESGTDLIIINPGVKIKIQTQNQNWCEIKLPNGKKGWIKKENFEKI